MAIKISGETVIDDSKKGLFNDVVVNGGSGESGEITLNCENNSHGVKLKGPAHCWGRLYADTARYIWQQRRSADNRWHWCNELGRSCW